MKYVITLIYHFYDEHFELPIGATSDEQKAESLKSELEKWIAKYKRPSSKSDPIEWEKYKLLERTVPPINWQTDDLSMKWQTSTFDKNYEFVVYKVLDLDDTHE